MIGLETNLCHRLDEQNSILGGGFRANSILKPSVNDFKEEGALIPDYFIKLSKFVHFLYQSYYVGYGSGTPKFYLLRNSCNWSHRNRFLGVTDLTSFGIHTGGRGEKSGQSKKQTSNTLSTPTLSKDSRFTK